jgi:hypothetical protein
MMGPLSVAQYLPPGQLTFDYIIMDEASQLKPEDALGAIARAHHVIVVGDHMQLPPQVSLTVSVMKKTKTKTIWRNLWPNPRASSISQAESTFQSASSSGIIALSTGV